MSKNGMHYPYAYDKGGKLSRFFGVEGIPHAVLVDAGGTVVWAGHPARLGDAQLQQATIGALSKPLHEWPAEAKAARTAFLKRDFKGALAAAASDELGEVRKALQGSVESLVAAMNEARKKGDYLGALTLASTLQKELAGLPEEAETVRVTSEINGDAKAKEIIKGQQKLAKIGAKELKKKKDVAAAIEDLKKLKGQYPGTFVETEADALIQSLSGSKDG